MEKAGVDSTSKKAVDRFNDGIEKAEKKLLDSEKEILREIKEQKRSSDGTRKEDKQFRVIVYISVLMFSVLLIYGYSLMYILTKDIHEMSQNMALMNESVNRNMNIMSENMAFMQLNVNAMTKTVLKSMPAMSESAEKMTVLMEEKIPEMNNNMEKMADLGNHVSYEITKMNQGIDRMSYGVSGMSREVNGMNRTMNNPMGSMMKSMFPF